MHTRDSYDRYSRILQLGQRCLTRISAWILACSLLVSLRAAWMSLLRACTARESIFFFRSAFLVFK